MGPFRYEALLRYRQGLPRTVDDIHVWEGFDIIPICVFQTKVFGEPRSILEGGNTKHDIDPIACESSRVPSPNYSHIGL